MLSFGRTFGCAFGRAFSRHCGYGFAALIIPASHRYARANILLRLHYSYLALLRFLAFISFCCHLLGLFLSIELPCFLSYL